VVYSDYVDLVPGNVNTQDDVIASDSAPLKDEGWGMSEIMRASWAAAKVNRKFKADLWDELKNPKSFTRGHPNDWRMNWMRAAVSFTATRGGPLGQPGDKVEILQEFFVPLDRFTNMLDDMRTVLRAGNKAGINLLSCTVRMVQQDKTGTVLAYAPKSKMVCIALDATVPVDNATGTRAPSAAVRSVFSGLIDKAIGHGGTFYLPYWRFASQDQFDQGYPGGKAGLRAAIATYDPQRKFWNSFLEQYLG
jgi:hypothetical protein